MINHFIQLLNKHLGLAVLLFGVAYQVYPCPITPFDQKNGGQCIEMDGAQIYLHVSGKKTPTIVFISGLGGDTTDWNKVVPQVLQFARVVTYDRPGLGKSQPCQSCEMITAKDSVATLKILLNKAHINPPYILVGHSLGGLYAQLYAAKYPTDVSGMVLVDSTYRKAETNIVMPSPSKPSYKEALGMQESKKQLQAVTFFPEIPLIVLTATHHSKRINEADWQKWQRDLVTLSPKGMQIIAWNSGHYIQNDQPQLVVDAIDTLVHEEE